MHTVVQNSKGLEFYLEASDTIASGTFTNIDEVKKRCIETPGCAGFVVRDNNGEICYESQHLMTKSGTEDDQFLNHYKLEEGDENLSPYIVDYQIFHDNEFRTIQTRTFSFTR